MYLISIPVLLSLDVLQPHDVMLQANMIVEYSGSLDGRIIYVTHEWSRKGDHPDPLSEKLRCLQRLLKQMMAGRLPRVRSEGKQSYQQQGHQPSSSTDFVTPEEMQAALPAMYLWVDYCCLPARNFGVESKTGEPAAHITDARASIPSYLERTTMVIVLAPPSADAQTIATYHAQGWNRFELLAAFLCRRNLPIMVVDGTHPRLSSAHRALALPPGEGSFSCGADDQMAEDKRLVHALLLALIKVKVDFLFDQRKLFEARFLVCVQHMLLRGLLLPRAVGTSKEQAQTAGGGSAAVGPAGDGSLEASLFRKELRWRADQDEAQWVHRTGASLLFFAALADNLQVLRWAILQDNSTALRRHRQQRHQQQQQQQQQQRRRRRGQEKQPSPLPRDSGRDLDRGLSTGWPLLNLFEGQTPLLAAVAFAGWDAVSCLLKAGADPAATCGPPASPTTSSNRSHHRNRRRRFDAVALACSGFRGSDDPTTLHRWVGRFKGGCDLSALVGGPVMAWTPLLIAAKTQPGAAVVDLLVHLGADVRHELSDGSSVLHVAAAMNDADSTGAIIGRLLELNPILLNINRPSRPRRRGHRMRWYCFFAMARAAVRWRGLPRVKQPLRRLALGYGGTPLHHAVVCGNVAAAKLLVAAGADVDAVDGNGRTPLGAARIAFGRHVPAVLYEALGKAGEMPP